MKLYYSPGACSLSPHIVAREAGVPIDLVKVDLKAHKTEDGRDFYSINPRGYVPTLQFDDGTVLREGPAIVQYLADQNPSSGLAPAAGTKERVYLQEWLAFISTELHKQFSPLFNPAFPEEVKKLQREKVIKAFGELEKRLADRPFLLGNQFTAADAYAFTVSNWAPPMGIDLQPFPNLIAYRARVSAREKVQQALKEEGLFKG